MPFQEDMRAAVVTLLGSYAQAASVKLQVYPGRPRSVNPPTAFVDVMRETITYNGHMMLRTCQADVVLLHGTFDSAEAVAQKDDFVDGFIGAVRTASQTAIAGAEIGVSSTEDDPTFLPEWLGREAGGGRTYFATRITVEGYIGD